MINWSFYKSYKFMRANAGYVVGHRALGAIALARAELWAEKNNVYFTWEPEQHDYEDMLGNHAYWCATARRVAAGYNQYGEKRNYYGYQGACEHEVQSCALFYAADDDSTAECIASLGGIIDASREYRRVIEAELALEAMNDIEEHKSTYLYEGCLP